MSTLPRRPQLVLETSQAHALLFRYKVGVWALEPASQGSHLTSTASSLAEPCLSLPICKPCTKPSPLPSRGVEELG